MKNHVTTNASICLLNDDSKDVVFTFFFYKVGKNQNGYKKKDGEGGEALKGWKFINDLVSQEGWEAMIVLFLL
jgi:hypothetical protein